MKARRYSVPVILILAATFIAASAAHALAWTPLPVKQDPLVFMPGSQPGDVQNFENSGRCENCHSNYNPAVEPGSNWRGSMMAQAARDPLWYACLTVSAQDSIWAIGNPNATDICIRCHTPPGWLEGASDPTNTSALSGSQLDGVQCDFCHRKIDAFAENGQPDVPAETNSTAIAAAQATYSQNILDLSALRLFGGNQPFLNALTNLPVWYGLFPAYREEGAGQYFVAASSGSKYGPYWDADARHKFNYSRYHKSQEFCHSCHDVSNPVLANLTLDASATTKFAAASYFHVERTSSEFLLSAYGSGGSATTSIPGVPYANKCQDCHMRDVTGAGCDKRGAPIRSDLPLHDLTGGNTWILGILASADPNWSGYDPYNYAILSGAKYAGASVDVAGLSSYGDELDRGVKRTNDQLKMAASLFEVGNTASDITIRVRNNTGHKLISGFPEGRRMFLNIKWYNGADIIGEVNPYAPLVKQTVGGNDVYVSGGDITVKTPELIWEAEMSSSLTSETKSFHFALATSRHKDNRIPPKGFNTAGMTARMTQPVWNGADAPGYFTVAEYAGGYDDVTVAKPAGTTSYVATLYYQTTSREYVKFLRDEIQGYTAPDAGTRTLLGNGVAGDAPYRAQTDPFFANLKGWGSAIWDLWVHNGGSAPVQMAILGASPQPPQPLTADPPTNVRASWSRKTGDISVTWSAPASGANGFYVYRATTSGGPYTRVGMVTNGATTGFTDSGPFTPGTYYYVVTTYKVDKAGVTYESVHSNEANTRVR